MHTDSQTVVQKSQKQYIFPLGETIQHQFLTASAVFSGRSIAKWFHVRLICSFWFRYHTVSFVDVGVEDVLCVRVQLERTA